MIRIGGLQPMTGLDFPGRLAAVLFLQGCPWHCRYCHNPHLLAPQSDALIPFDDVLAFLDRRRGLLDGVVFSGGEPTLQPRLHEAMREVRARGFAVGLHTGGMYPRQLERLLPLLDWVGLDIKAPAAHYDAITQRRNSARNITRSLRLLVDSGIDFECRTTWHPGLFDEDALHALGGELAAAGVRHWALQRCRDATATQSWHAPDLSRLAGYFEAFQFRDG